MIAALYVQTGGCYFGLPDVDPWDEARDARLYAGPHPVVAHPPCHLWTNLAAVNYKRWGGEHNRPGNDGGKFASALAAVLRFGGVLEHPAYSNAWAQHELIRPREKWTNCFDDYWVCEVWQSAYGHKARKKTWLLYSGSQAPPDLDWTRPPGTHQCGFKFGTDKPKPTLGKKAASATPPAFRDLLLGLARRSALGACP